MAGTKLDGAGTQKMKTLEEALVTLQTLHGLVETMAIDVNAQKPVGMIGQRVRRLAGPLQGQLKGQFGPLADMVSAMILAATRGGSDKLRLRFLRDYVAQIRTSIDVSMSKVKEVHSVEVEIADE